MAASEIKAKYGAATTITITLASLASSSSGLGRQSTIIDNTTTRYQRIYIAYSIKLGTSPNNNSPVTFYLIRDDTGAGPIRDDGAGATDAALQLKNAHQVEIATAGGSPATGDVLSGVFVIDNPGPKWGIVIVNGTGVALNSSAGNHNVEFFGENPEAQ